MLMGVFGLLALVAAIAVAIVALTRTAGGTPEDGSAPGAAEKSDVNAGRANVLANVFEGISNTTLLKLAAWLALAAVLFTAKLFPVALMILVAAGGVTAIEIWRERTIRADNAESTSNPYGAGGAPAPGNAGSDSEAASILGISIDANAADIRAAHKRLIARLHPDQGGSDFLASQINAARDRMLARSAIAGTSAQTLDSESLDTTSSDAGPYSAPAASRVTRDDGVGENGNTTKPGDPPTDIPGHQS